jgi:hypothetical protein
MVNECCISQYIGNNAVMEEGGTGVKKSSSVKKILDVGGAVHLCRSAVVKQWHTCH